MKKEILDILNNIRAFMVSNSKRDVYQCEITINKDNIDRVIMIRQFDVSKGLFPSRRLVAKAFEKQIKDTVLKHKLYNSSITIKILSKIGMFRKKEIDYS